MNKKNNFALFATLFLSLLGSLALNLSAQKNLSVETDQPQEIKVADIILQNYIDLSSLPMNERREAFGLLLAADKANVFKLHFALQLTNRPNLTTDQKKIILESLSMTTTETYDRTKNRKITDSVAQIIQARSTIAFSPQEASEIFANLGSGPANIERLQKYVDFSKLKSMSARKELFSTASPQTKSDYWKTHFALSLVLFPDLNETQKDVILYAIAQAVPQIYQVSKTSSEWRSKVEEPMTALSSRAVEAFSKEEGLRIFMKLGGDANEELIPAVCNCSRGSIPACWSEYCINSSCNRTDGGCGVLWVWDCDGRCY